MLKKITLAVMALSMSYGCQKDEIEILPTNSFEFSVITNDLTGLASRQSDTECFYVDLIAGQNYSAGKVAVEKVLEDGIVYVYISYISNNGWIIKETHLYAGDVSGIPETRKGNPKPGVFEKKMGYEANIISDFEVEYKIVYTAFDGILDGDLFAAAHAVVVKYDTEGNETQRETAWGSGIGFDGDSWAMYFPLIPADEPCPVTDSEDQGGK